MAIPRPSPKVSATGIMYVAHETYKRITRMIRETDQPVFETMNDRANMSVSIAFSFKLEGHPVRQACVVHGIHDDMTAREAILKATKVVSEWIIDNRYQPRL